MATIRYLFGNLDTREILVELPLTSVSVNTKLNEWGTFRGTFHLDTSGVDNADAVAGTTPGRSFVVVERDDVPIWDGIVWTRTYDSQSKALSLTGRSYEAYAETQLIDVDFSRESIEQRNIFCDLWSAMQAPSNRNLGINVPAAFATVLPRSVNVLASEYKDYYQVMGSIADGVDGFDWTITTIRQNNQYVRNLRIGYPFLGTTDAAGLSFDYPGNIINYWETESMSGSGTNVYLLGAGEGTSMVVGTAVQQDLLDSGFKRYDLTISRKDVESQTQIDSLALQYGARRRAPVTVIKVVVKADLEPVFGSYGLGDTATLSIIDPKHPESITTSARVVAYEYKPQSDDTVDEVELIFEGDELNEG